MKSRPCLPQVVKNTAERVLLIAVGLLAAKIVFVLCQALTQGVYDNFNRPFYEYSLIKSNQAVLFDPKKDWDLSKFGVSSDLASLDIWFLDSRPLSRKYTRELRGEFSVQLELEHDAVSTNAFRTQDPQKGEFNVLTPSFQVHQDSAVIISVDFIRDMLESSRHYEPNSVTTIQLCRWDLGSLYTVIAEYENIYPLSDFHVRVPNLRGGLYILRIKRKFSDNFSLRHPFPSEMSILDSEVTVKWKIIYEHEEFLKEYLGRADCVTFTSETCKWKVPKYSNSTLHKHNDSDIFASKYILIFAQKDTFVRIVGRFNYPLQQIYDIQAMLIVLLMLFLAAVPISLFIISYRVQYLNVQHSMASYNDELAKSSA
jgi:hypothetical protein